MTWLEHLPWVLLGLRAAPKEEAWVSSAEATYGALSGPAQPAAAAPTCTAGGSYQGGNPQHSKACQGGGEGEGGGHLGGVLRLRARRGVHRTTGRHVLLPILRAGEGAEEVAAGDRSDADMGICD